jgi:hypothetical protein
MYRGIVFWFVVITFLITGTYAFGHAPLFTPEENAWLDRQRARDGTKCCDERDAHVGVNVRWRMNGGRFEVFIMDAWHPVPPGRLHRHDPNDPSPWPGEALLFFTPFPQGPSIWCFRPGQVS